jgi:hypothetical protein
MHETRPPQNFSEFRFLKGCGSHRDHMRKRIGSHFGADGVDIAGCPIRTRIECVDE